MKLDSDSEYQMPNRQIPPVEPTGLRLIDKQVAAAVFGLQYWWNEYEGCHGMRVPPGTMGNPYPTDQWYPLTHYSTSWEAAGLIVEHFPRFVVSRFPDHGWRCYVWPEWAEGSLKPGFIADGETGPLAICLAALQAVGVEIPQ